MPERRKESALAALHSHEIRTMTGAIVVSFGLATAPVLNAATTVGSSGAIADTLTDSTKLVLWETALNGSFVGRSKEPFRLSPEFLCITAGETECASSAQVFVPSMRVALRKRVGGCPAVGSVERMSVAISTPLLRSDSATILIRTLQFSDAPKEINEQVFRVRLALHGGSTPHFVMIYHGQISTDGSPSLLLPSDNSCGARND